MPSNPNLITRNLADIAAKSGNLYESLAIITKRARQLSAKQKEELTSKLADFASTVDNLEEVFENREQIEISRYYERLAKPTTVATDEFLDDKLVFVRPEIKSKINRDEASQFILADDDE